MAWIITELWTGARIGFGSGVVVAAIELVLPTNQLAELLKDASVEGA